jgi:capsular polysaccharide export protein
MFANRCSGDLELAKALIPVLAEARVGGCFWGAQPDLPSGRDIVLLPSNPAELHAMARRAQEAACAGRIVVSAPASWTADFDAPRLPERSDPWHLVDRSGAVWASADHEGALVAAILGKSLNIFGKGRFAALGQDDRPPAALWDIVRREMLSGIAYRDPFTGNRTDVLEIVDLLAEWRRLINSNRMVREIFGVAGWKRETVDAILWAGSGAPRYASRLRSAISGASPDDIALMWKSRTPARVAAAVERRGVTVGEVEDGFIRSAGLGANCVPPLSIVVDRRGIYFDPRASSDLEDILQNGHISPQTVRRAARIRERLVQAGVSKYGRGTEQATRPGGTRRHVLVTGQVEDDRSMLCGGGGCTNLDLVRRARALEPDACLIYKPHPDVEAGHRKGHVPDALILEHADQIERERSIVSLLDSVDAVHVITSLAGFEALMRGKEVTAHGAPFFAGWGVTHDLGNIPARRTTRRTVDEIIAAALILYPRYLDPVTRLPCPPEVLIERLATDQAVFSSPLIRLRQMQGRLNAIIKRIRITS